MYISATRIIILYIFHSIILLFILYNNIDIIDKYVMGPRAINEVQRRKNVGISDNYIANKFKHIRQKIRFF